MTPDDIDWGSTEMAYFECFAAPGELARLSGLARRFADRADDFEALTDGLAPLVDGLEAAGYSDGNDVHDRAQAALEDAPAIVDAWRAFGELSRREIERVVWLARRGSR